MLRQSIQKKEVKVEKLKLALESLEEQSLQVNQSPGDGATVPKTIQPAPPQPTKSSSEFTVFVHPEPPKPTEKIITSSEVSTSPEDHQSPLQEFKVMDKSVEVSAFSLFSNQQRFQNLYDTVKTVFVSAGTG